MTQLVKQITFDAGDLGRSVAGFDFDAGGFLISSGLNSNPFNPGGFNQMRLHYEVTRAAATDLSFYLAAAAPGRSSYGRGRFGDVNSSGGVTAISTYYPQQYVVPAMATAANQNGYFDIPVNCLGNMRIEAISGTAASTDRVNFWITLGKV